MFNPSPHVPSIRLSNVHDPYFGHTQNMNLEPEQRQATERRARREEDDGDLESDDNYLQDPDHRSVRGCRDYARRDLPEAVFFRREQDNLEIALMERRVVEANRALGDAIRDLKETKMRIRDRRRDERLPEFVDDVYERASQQPVRDHPSPAENGSRPSTPQLSSSSLPTRSRSPSPYRFTSRTESEIPRLPSQPSQSVHEPRSRSRNLNATVHKGEGGTVASASQEQVYQSFSKIHDLAKEFQTLKQNFVYPSVIEFQKPGSQAGEIITVWAHSTPTKDESMSNGTIGSEDWEPGGELAYTRTNEALHTYSYALEKLLGKLDSVDSWNESSVRTKRRGIIGEIEQEASKLERYRQEVWRDYCGHENVKMYG